MPPVERNGNAIRFDRVPLGGWLTFRRARSIGFDADPLDLPMRLSPRKREGAELFCGEGLGPGLSGLVEQVEHDTGVVAAGTELGEHRVLAPLQAIDEHPVLGRAGVRNLFGLSETRARQMARTSLA